MERALDLLADNSSVPGRLVTSGLVVVVAAVISAVLGRLLARRSSDPYGRYYARKGARYAVAAVTVVALAIVWQAFAGRLGVVLGLATAGVAFAMQEVIGAVAGWFNIVSGRIFRVGDRIQMGGVRGDVIDITPLRTKVMEIGSSTDGGTWVRGRQYTGRIVALSNKTTFTEPFFNYSSIFDFIWEELTIPVSHDGNWHEAETILQEEAARASSSKVPTKRWMPWSIAIQSGGPRWSRGSSYVPPTTTWSCPLASSFRCAPRGRSRTTWRDGSPIVWRQPASRWPRRPGR